MRAQTLAQVRLLPLARLHGRYGRPCARTCFLLWRRLATTFSVSAQEIQFYQDRDSPTVERANQPLKSRKKITYENTVDIAEEAPDVHL